MQNFYIEKPKFQLNIQQSARRFPQVSSSSVQVDSAAEKCNNCKYWAEKEEVDNR